jgi:hypothetical protein
VQAVLPSVAVFSLPSSFDVPFCQRFADTAILPHLSNHDFVKLSNQTQAVSRG